MERFLFWKRKQMKEGQSMKNILVHSDTTATYKESQSESAPLLTPTVTTGTYLRRFWILLLFSTLASYNVLLWNTWGPLTESVLAAFPNWDPATVAMMANWGNITFVIFILPMCWSLYYKGLRITTVASAFMMVMGTAVRCISESAEVFTAMCHVGAIMIGISAILFGVAPPMLAAVWFPAKERTTAMGAARASNLLGTALAFLTPLEVRTPDDDAPTFEIRDDIAWLMHTEAYIALALFLLVLSYFPERPPLPPSLSSNVVRTELFTSLKILSRNKTYWLLIISYGLTGGISSFWLGVINLSLIPIGVHENDVMWIAVTTLFLSGLATLCSARFTDLSYGHVKKSLFVLLGLAFVAYIWLALIISHALPIQLWQVHASIALSQVFTYAAAPLYMELACELAYPCPEAAVGGFVTAAESFVGITFSFVFFIPNIGYSWITYVLVAGGALAVVPLLFVRESYSRSDLDRGKPHEAECVVI